MNENYRGKVEMCRNIGTRDGDSSKEASKTKVLFYVGTPCGVHLFDHLLRSIFQSSITYLHYTISSSSFMFHGDLLCACGLSCTASVFLTCGYSQVVFLEDFALVIWSLNPHDRDSIQSQRVCLDSEKFKFVLYKYSPLPGFELRTLPRPALQANALPIELSRWYENLRTLVVACANLVFLKRESNTFCFFYMS